MANPLLTVRHLNVGFITHRGEIVHAVKDLNFDVHRGETLGIVGESGSGKSQIMMALMGLLANNGKATGSAMFKGVDLIEADPHQLEQLRGKHMGLVQQDPLSSLNPYISIGDQIIESACLHHGWTRAEALKQAEALLARLAINEPARRLRQYPHELSGGMRQRVCIAMAMLTKPDLLILDEPTTALDVVVQAEIIDMLKKLKKNAAAAQIFITHDLSLAAHLCDRVLVMEQGECREIGATETIFKQPQDDYTKRLLECLKTVGTLAPSKKPKKIESDKPLLKVEHLTVSYELAGGTFVKAVDHASLDIRPGETLGIVGVSGCGKSTMARAIMGLVPTQNGRVLMHGKELTQARTLTQRKAVQIVFQDPVAALNPRMTVGASIREPLALHYHNLSEDELQAEVVTSLEQVGLDPSWADRFPHQLSGGQCQRVGIARAMILEPEIIICDEAISSLDVTTQAEIIKLLQDFQKERKMSILFISHNLAAISRISDRVVVMHAGRVVESGDASQVIHQPKHVETKKLLASVLSTDLWG